MGRVGWSRKKTVWNTNWPGLPDLQGTVLPNWLLPMFRALLWWTLLWPVLTFQLSFLEACLQSMTSVFRKGRNCQPQVLGVRVSSSAGIGAEDSIFIQGKMSSVSPTKFFHITPSSSNTYTPRPQEYCLSLLLAQATLHINPKVLKKEKKYNLNP